MSRKAVKVGIVLVLGILVAGVLAVWVLPSEVEAGYGGGRGNGNGEMVSGTGADGTGAGYHGRNGWGGNGLSAGQGAGLMSGASTGGSLSEAEIEALQAALQDERTAKVLYEQAIADLGRVQPLTSIEAAEERHIAALENLFNRYGLETPAGQGSEQEISFATLADACAAGVTAETANVALYDQLLAQADNPDLVRVFTALQSASQNRHLPAFEACAD